MELQESSSDVADRELFVRLLMRHDRVIRAFLRSLLPTHFDVDEVMQEVSVVAWRKFGDLHEPGNFRRWVCRIARYEVLAYRRRQARDRLLLSEKLEQLIAEEGIDELSLREQQLKALEGCVEKLPAGRKQLVLSAYSANQTMKSIAEENGKTPEAIYKLLSRLRYELLRCIERTTAETAQ